MNKDLAIVIPCYNNYKLTQDTIKSLSTTTKSNYVVILVDDNSSDSTSKFSEQADSNLVYLKNTTNLGVNKSWNVGLSKALVLGSKYICIANNDLLFTDGWDIPLIEALNNGYDVVSPYSTERVLPTDFPNGSTRHVNPNPLNILGCCFMFTSGFIDKCGFFPEDMLHYYGDNWVCDISKKNGLKVGHIKDSYIHHLYCKTTSKLSSDIFFADQKAYKQYCTTNDIK